MAYLTRTADIVLDNLLEAFGAVLIEGPKWCGKTTTAEQMAKSVIKLQDPGNRNRFLSETRGWMLTALIYRCMVMQMGMRSVCAS